MRALTVGVTTPRDPACKRGLAVNIAASLARDPVRPARVCVLDADPLTLDVTTRLSVRGPLLEDFADRDAPPASALSWVHEPPLWVVPSAGAGVGLIGRAAERAVNVLAADFDVVVCDVVGGPSGPALMGGCIDRLDWLLVAVTPDAESVDDAARFLGQFGAAQARGDIAATVNVGVVTTGDEGSIGLAPEVVAETLGRSANGGEVLGSVRQLWGRAVPNLGFGAALGIAELDDAVAALFNRLGFSPVAVDLSRAS